MWLQKIGRTHHIQEIVVVAATRIFHSISAAFVAGLRGDVAYEKADFLIDRGPVN